MRPKHCKAWFARAIDRYRSGNGWEGVKNGQLLRAAAADFDVFITSDKNLRHQQNLADIDLAIILLPSNQVPVVKALLPKINDALSNIGKNDFIEI